MTSHEDMPERQAREAHQAALRSLSPHVRTQLQRRTRLALAGQGATDMVGSPRWRWIAAPVLALLLAFALPWPGPRDADAPAPAPIALETPPAVELAAPLEQDPDFYLWLASADAVALAGDRP